MTRQLSEAWYLGPSLLLAVFCFSSPVPLASAGDGRCPEPVGKDFSSASPVDVGLSPERLLRLNEALDAEKYDVRSLLILRDCKLVFERYKDGIGREHNHTLYSVTKSISATLVGALLYQGKLKSIDTPIADLTSKPRTISEYKWKKAQRITLRNVMQMSSGLDYKHDPVAHPIYDTREDRFAVALSPELAVEPGTRFSYSDGDVSITGAVIAAAADTNLYRFAKEALFDPLQMRNYDWWFRDRAGRYPGGWGLRMRPMDMVKVGQLYIQRGNWNGQRIFDASFVDLAWEHGASVRYALHWWIGNMPQAKGVAFYFADGLKGQGIYVFPALSIVVAFTASLPEWEKPSFSSLIVGALIDAAHEGTVASTSNASAALIDLQKKGFNGETRVVQWDQDRPRRF